jgi:hypothetical protein
MVAGFLANSGVLKILAHGESYLFPNYLYSLYGIAAGGKGWGFIKGDRPDLMAMAEPGRTQSIYSATLDLIKAHPLVFIWNMLKQYWYFVLYGNTSLFSYLFTNIDWFNILMMVSLYAFCILTIILLIKKRTELKSLVMLGIVIGIVLSVPFVPPQDESNMRAFAVTVPVMALLPAISMQWLVDQIIEKFKIRFHKAASVNLSIQAPELFSRTLTVVLIVVTMVIAIAPAFFLNGVDQLKSTPQVSCPAGETSYVWRNLADNNIWVANKVEEANINSLTTQKMERLFHDIYVSDKMPLFQSMRQKIFISEQVSYLDGTSAWLFAPPDVVKEGNGIYAGCGKFNKSTDFYLFDFIDITSGQKIP